MKWSAFKAASPNLANETERLFGRRGLALVGTLRKDGSPRISPVEVFFLPQAALLGMMSRSMKALDLLRDPRCVLHTPVSDPNGSEPELKLYGRAMACGKEERARYQRAYLKRWKRRTPPNFPAHVFSFEVESVALVRYDTKKMTMIVKRWSSKKGIHESRRQYP